MRPLLHILPLLAVAGWLAASIPRSPATRYRFRIAYATFLGGTAWDQAREVIPAADGSVWVGSQSASEDMPTTPGAFQPKYAGDDPRLGPGGLVGGDCHLARLSPDGRRLLAATFFGGSKQERNVYGMETDREGNIVLCSTTRSPDLPTTEGAFQRRFAGGDSDWFAAKLSPDLRHLLWCTYVGGSSGESPRGGLALDEQGNVVLVGQSHSTDFPTTPGAYQRQLRGGQDAAIVKLKSDGSGLLFSTFLGGSSGENEGIIGAQVAPNGDIVVGGHTTSADFPVTPGAAQSRFGGQCDVFLARLSADGSRLIWATYVGGSGNEFAEHRVALDRDGTVLLTGFTASPDFPTTPAAFQRQLGGRSDGFLTVLSPDGKRFLCSTYLGGSGSDFWLMPTRDAQGNVWVVGETGSRDFPVTPGAIQPRFGGGQSDGALAIFNSDGSKLLYATYLGGSGDEMIRSLALGPKGEVYLVGNTNSRDFPVTPGAFQTRFGGGTGDSFVVKLEPET